mmetsp:Transcript_6206/g.25132  ORF Transcript_6206/g.25132 Transcript_6206/m.25132 type:complete len:780 (+) Transcript_6206:281-2620(+)
MAGADGATEGPPDATYAALEGPRFVTAPEPARQSVLSHSKSHPRMLESNATSHVWPLGALAELLDNAQDQECGATRVDVDAFEFEPGKMALSVQDDGVGMARSNLHCMLSFGFSSKEHVVGNVGRFGIGFKSGSMRIAHDALILSRREGQASAALLSTTFLNAIEADDILIPMFTWTTETAGGAGKHTYVASEPSNTAEWEENMSVIEQYTYLASEAAVLRELDKITTPTGTRIVLFNLKDPPEFDFSVKNDVRMLGIDPDEQNRTSARRPVYQQHRPGQQMTLDVPEDYSLRAYMEVLYLRPTVTFSLRGELIEPRCPISRLALEYYKFEDYTPKDLPEERRAPVIVHCGYQEEKSKHCGFHIYNKNRLIRMYQRFGAQLQANAMMKDMLGVVEADCLEPTHNKQAFNTTDVAYQKCQKHLEKCMNDYYFGVQNLRLAGIGAGGKRRIGAPQGGTRKKGKSAGKDGKGTKGKGKGKKNGSDGDSDDDDAWVAKRAKSAAGGKNKLDLRTFFPRVLRKLMSHKNSWAFNEPVDAEYWGVLDYYEIIKTPMDFGTIATKLDAGEYRTEGSAHGPQKFVADVRQVFYNAWTYNTPGHQVYEFAQEVGRIFETELAKAVGDEDVWNLKAGNVLAMCGPAPAKEKPAGALAAGDGDAAAKPEPGAAAFAVDSEAIKAMVETRAAQAIGEANAARDEALAKLHDERAAREVFEAELEAQMAESLRAAREEEKSRYAKLESEKDTLLSALSDSSEMKRMYQERVKALEAEVKALKEKVGEGQVVS